MPAEQAGGCGADHGRARQRQQRGKQQQAGAQAEASHHRTGYGHVGDQRHGARQGEEEADEGGERALVGEGGLGAVVEGVVDEEMRRLGHHREGEGEIDVAAVAAKGDGRVLVFLFLLMQVRTIAPSHHKQK